MTAIIPVMGPVMGSVLRGPFDAGASFSPTDLGASLLAFWDAERSDLITQAATLISSWKDVVAGYDAVQAVGASKFVYSATSFNGRPGATVDGVDDEMTLAPVPAGIPTGANACEMWAVLSQSALVADATNRSASAYGGNSANTARILQRSVVSGANNFVLTVGTGAGAVTSTNTTVDFSGRHVLRSIVGATAAQADINGVAGPSAAVVPGTATNRLRLGANNSGTAGAFWSGVINAIVVTAPLNASQVEQMLAWGNTRRGA